jgi:hypothetical protein
MKKEPLLDWWDLLITFLTVFLAFVILLIL